MKNKHNTKFNNYNKNHFETKHKHMKIQAESIRRAIHSQSQIRLHSGTRITFKQHLIKSNDTLDSLGAFVLFAIPKSFNMQTKQAFHAFSKTEYVKESQN